MSAQVLFLERKLDAFSIVCILWQTVASRRSTKANLLLICPLGHSVHLHTLWFKKLSLRFYQPKDASLWTLSLLLNSPQRQLALPRLQKTTYLYLFTGASVQINSLSPPLLPPLVSTGVCPPRPPRPPSAGCLWGRSSCRWTLHSASSSSPASLAAPPSPPAWGCRGNHSLLCAAPPLGAAAGVKGTTFLSCVFDTAYFMLRVTHFLFSLLSHVLRVWQMTTNEGHHFFDWSRI